MANQLELRREIFSLLSWHLHHTDASPADTLLRLALKGTGLDFSQCHWKAFERLFSVDELRSLAAENREAPHSTVAPPILIQFNWEFTLIDGQKRVSHWRRSKRTDPVRCLIARFRGTPR